MELYFWNQKEQKFELNTIPEWTGYELMIQVATEALTLIKENKDYKTVRNLCKAFCDIDRCYGFSDAENIYHLNISNIAGILTTITQNMMYLDSAETKEEKKALKGLLERGFTQVETLIRSLADGVVTLNGTKSQGSPFFHITDPDYDVYTYKGRNFYVWDGWYYSSRKVMEEMADKFFGEE